MENDSPACILLFSSRGSGTCGLLGLWKKTWTFIGTLWPSSCTSNFPLKPSSKRCATGMRARPRSFGGVLPFQWYTLVTEKTQRKTKKAPKKIPLYDHTAWPEWFFKSSTNDRFFPCLIQETENRSWLSSEAVKTPWETPQMLPLLVYFADTGSLGPQIWQIIIIPALVNVLQELYDKHTWLTC